MNTKNIRSRAKKNEFGAIRKLPSGKYHASFINLTGAGATELESDLLQASLGMISYLISQARRALQPTPSGEQGEIVAKALAISKQLSDLPEELQQSFVSFVSETCLVFQFRELSRKFDNQTVKELRRKLPALERAGYFRFLPSTSTGRRPLSIGQSILIAL